MKKVLENGTIEVREFIFAGNALFTVVRTSDMKRHTYKVIESKDKKVFFVRLLTIADNDSPYQYLGFISKTTRQFTTSKASRITANASGFQMFNDLFTAIKLGTLTAEDTTYQVWHEGTCGRCGRTLTVPASIASGYGPECIKLQSLKLSVNTHRHSTHA